MRFEKIIPIFNKIEVFSPPPAWYHGTEFSILKRNDTTDEYLAINILAARWVRTTILGAQAIQKIDQARSAKSTQISITTKEDHFLKQLSATGFFDDATTTQPATPSLLHISVTDKCNLSCSYCFFGAGGDANKGATTYQSLPTDKIRSLLTEAKQLNDGIRIFVTGGEPFLFKGIYELFQIIKEHGLYAAVVTNGTLLTRKSCEKLKKIGIDEVRISIDGVSPNIHETYRPKTFEKVKSSILNLKDCGVVTVLSMTVTKENIHEVHALAEFALENGVAFNYSHMLPTGRGATHHMDLPNYEALVQEYKNVEQKFGYGLLNKEGQQGVKHETCGLANKTVYIGLNGEAAPCNLLAHSHKIGNAFSNGLKNLLLGEGATRVQRTVDEISGCSDCYIRYACGGTCRASSYFYSGAINAKGPDCKFKYHETIQSMWTHGPVVSL
ncbi:radical SAM protein [Chitinimonas taiwanensis]|uniref:radical SAM protein n=1 Tax=Chitinimonas taiwanensis TaxID=240412 RepID=UPI0035B33F9E